MNWLLFALFAYAAVSVQVGLRVLWSVGGVTPNLLLVLGVFVALLAPSTAAGWAMLVLGLLHDLTAGATAGVLIGPGVVGYLLGAYTVTQLRTLVFRESVLTVSAMTLVAGGMVHLAIVALLTLRGLPWPVGEPVPGWDAFDQLVQRFLELVYTAILALPAGWLLLRTRRWWGFGHSGGRGERRF